MRPEVVGSARWNDLTSVHCGIRQSPLWDGKGNVLSFDAQTPNRGYIALHGTSSQLSRLKVVACRICDHSPSFRAILDKVQRITPTIAHLRALTFYFASATFEGPRLLPAVAIYIVPQYRSPLPLSALNFLLIPFITKNNT